MKSGGQGKGGLEGCFKHFSMISGFQLDPVFEPSVFSPKVIHGVTVPHQESISPSIPMRHLQWSNENKTKPWAIDEGIRFWF